MVAIVVRALANGDLLVVPAGVVAQAWRNGRRQARLARLLGARICTIEALDDTRARSAGQLLGVSGTVDIVDASVVLAARRHGLGVITSDPGDLTRLDAAVRLVTV